MQLLTNKESSKDLAEGFVKEFATYVGTPESFIRYVVYRTEYEIAHKLP